MMKKIDNVATALVDIPAGIPVELQVEGASLTVTLLDPIPFGHKFAVKPIFEAEDILKYGEVIGMANRSIQPGEHVHVHNLDGKRGRGDRVGA
ncbi:D-galactarate dehydratase [Paenibacillus thalictri]|uniref:D-galactarate dehydratase n=2 Tax=Paenibacillus thalictri TaxID=2527873 RepID=A0A4Q9DLB6_9BACL|nr:UxaA family hydrolase [Paenibacillus thalictri]TBL75809.1 D-galactarate dehydratase [Paenibacillus thalictri]